MNSAKNGLAIVRELTKKADDRGCTSRVKPRRRLVQEEEKVRFSCKLHSDRHPFAPLNSKACAGKANYGILQVIKLQQINNIIHVGQFLCLRYFARLTKQCREFNGFA